MAAHGLEEAAQHVARRLDVDAILARAQIMERVGQFLGEALVLAMLEAEPFQRRLERGITDMLSCDDREDHVFLEAMNAANHRAEGAGRIDAFLPVDLVGQGIGNLLQLVAKGELVAMRLFQGKNGILAM